MGHAADRGARGDPRSAVHGGALTAAARRFDRFAAIDWSGAIGERLPGIAVAECEAEGAPRLCGTPGRWSRAAVAAWLEAEAAAVASILVGIDFSAALPFADAGAYFPGWSASPSDGPALWRLVDETCAHEPHLGTTRLLAEPSVAAHFRQRGARGGAVVPGIGRLRVTEAACRAGRLGPAVSSFTLVGPAQVGKASLAGMRLLHRLRGRVPIWPFDPVPACGPVIVEIYTAIAARAAGVTGGRTKLRDAVALDAALAALGAAPHAALARYDDHSTDALLAAAWLRRAIRDEGLWAPPALTAGLAATEGWTFGVP